MKPHSPEFWAFFRGAFSVAAYAAIALVALWARKALVAEGLSTINIRKRFAAACGLTTGLSSLLPSVAIRRFRFRLMCLLLVFLGYVVGDWWLVLKEERVTKQWLDDSLSSIKAPR
jgi:hypothetical protein